MSDLFMLTIYSIIYLCPHAPQLLLEASDSVSLHARYVGCGGSEPIQPLLQNPLASLSQQGTGTFCWGGAPPPMHLAFPLGPTGFLREQQQQPTPPGRTDSAASQPNFLCSVPAVREGGRGQSEAFFTHNALWGR